MNTFLEREGAEWAVFRVANGRIHCRAFFATRHEAAVRQSRLDSIRIIKTSPSAQDVV